MKKLLVNRRVIDRFWSYAVHVAGSSAVLLLLGIFLMLFINGLMTFSDVSLKDFFLGTLWKPSAYKEPQYGIVALILSSLILSILSMVIAIPTGVATAAYLAEYAPPRLERILKPAIEMLAAIPSVTLGFLGIVVIGPFVARIFHLSNGLNALTGSALLAIMSLPIIISISQDAIQSVPKRYKEGAYALGATRWETTVKVVIPASLSGIIASIMLGMGRAIGETMAVLMTTGNAAALPKSIFDSVQPLTATIAIEMGEVPFDTTHYHSLFALGVVLFIMTLIINVLADKVTKSVRK